MSHICDSPETSSDVISSQIPPGSGKTPDPVTSLFTSHLYRLTWLGGPQYLTGFFEPRPLICPKSVASSRLNMSGIQRSRLTAHLLRRRRLREWCSQWNLRLSYRSLVPRSSPLTGRASADRPHSTMASAGQLDRANLDSVAPTDPRKRGHERADHDACTRRRLPPNRFRSELARREQVEKAWRREASIRLLKRAHYYWRQRDIRQKRRKRALTNSHMFISLRKVPHDLGKSRVSFDRCNKSRTRSNTINIPPRTAEENQRKPISLRCRRGHQSPLGFDQQAIRTWVESTEGTDSTMARKRRTIQCNRASTDFLSSRIGAGSAACVLPSSSVSCEKEPNLAESHVLPLTKANLLRHTRMHEWMFRYQVLCRQLNAADQEKFSIDEQINQHAESATGPSTKRQRFFNASEKDQPTTQSSDTPVQTQATMLVSADQCQQTQQKPELIGLALNPCENTMNPVPQLFAPCKSNHGVCTTNTFNMPPTNLHCTQHVLTPHLYQGTRAPVPNFYGKRPLWHTNSNPCPHTATRVAVPCCNAHSCPTCVYGMSSCTQSPNEYWYPYDHHHHLCSSGSSHDHTPSRDCCLSSMHNSMYCACQRYTRMASSNGMCNSIEWTTLPVGCCGTTAINSAYPRLVRVPWKEGSLPNGSSNTTGTYPYTGSGSGGPTEGSELPYCCACWAKRYSEMAYRKTAFMPRDTMHPSGLFAQTFAPKRDTVDFAVSTWCNSQKRPTHIPVGSMKPPGVGENPGDLTGMTATAAHASAMPTLTMTNTVGPAALASQVIRVTPTQISVPTVIPGPTQASNCVCRTLPTTVLDPTSAVPCDTNQSVHVNHQQVAHNPLQPCLTRNAQDVSLKETVPHPVKTCVQPDLTLGLDMSVQQKDGVTQVRRKLAQVAQQATADGYRIPQPIADTAIIEPKQPWEVTGADVKSPDADKTMQQNYYGVRS
ncbi:unnamed protein product [Echinostoma caproni]|uniref:Uncharacterized protein n=1 Tax=Echinostoma caproni TaxID=27848 RepID=A0A183ADD9_9TREM|nr:unnamed protein product [Echinostoma caproni]